MSNHDTQIIKALRAAIGEYKQAIAQKDRAIHLQKQALSQLKTVIAQMIPHTDYSEEEKVRLLKGIGLEVKPKLEVVKDAN